MGGVLTKIHTSRDGSQPAPPGMTVDDLPPTCKVWIDFDPDEMF
jgi:hypothetical protein